MAKLRPAERMPSEFSKFVTIRRCDDHPTDHQFKLEDSEENYSDNDGNPLSDEDKEIFEVDQCPKCAAQADSDK